ncbi:Uncharacterized membrane protein [Spirosomataceae bacterium TFI 002]|nr:Uncharacterized membrane protein [Spirosomataceae bacterium TFI 002]
MKSNWKGLLENTLFVVTLLLLFLLIFESYIELPSWFQPMGRLHPLVLHFPITLLFLAFVYEVLPSKWFVENNEIYTQLANLLLLFAAISAGLTAVFGLFLSLESGYDPDSLFWHKYLGSGLVILSTILYWFKNWRPENKKVSKVIAFISLLALMIGAHKGADITHGEGFLLGDFGKKVREPVAFEDALVFEDLVMPILEDKCTSCHNKQKAKGELIMTSMADLLKGGKSGEIFTVGHPETSTLVERLLLPLEDEEHMPPSGKPQLDADEIAILRLWIKHKADVKLKLASIPPNDSLSILGRKRIGVKDKTKEYSFEAANPDVIEELNNPYRVIMPLSRNSPAVEVSFYGTKEYSGERLEELLKIKTQIVSLQLNKIPVKDADLKVIEQLENLDQLNVNFSEVSSSGLLGLKELKKLEKLSIAGIDINRVDIEKLIKAQKGLKSIHVWNTGASEIEIKELRKQFPNIEIVGGRDGLNEMLIQLNEPYIANSSAIFKDSLILQLGHPIKGVDMKLSMDNKAIDSLTSLAYVPNKIVIRESKAFKAKAYKNGWLSSEEVVLNVYQNKYDPDTVLLLTKLNRVHPANGSLTFFDKVLGKNGANNPAWANNWAGFQKNDMELILQYDKPVPVSSISLNFLVESETSIFFPESIQIWGGNDPNKLQLLTTVRPKQPTEALKGYIQLINCPIKTFTGTHFKVVARPLQTIPSWRSKTKRVALFLVDELFVN